MPKPRHIVAIDQGTTSTRAILFDDQARPVATAQTEYRQYYPAPGWVEQDPETIWANTVAVVREAIGKAGLHGADIAAIGITNQRETTVVWDRTSGAPVHRAIVWQDRRTAELCATLKAEGREALVRARTGLLLDPYFSATKLKWILDTVPDARERAGNGALAFGTIDSFLLWRLTGGAVHATDITNASRTMLYDIHAQRWSPELLELFGIPESLLPDVRENAGLFGVTDPELFGAPIPVGGMAGDQHAALIGHGCFTSGSAKATYGTGCFLLLNQGSEPQPAAPGILTTIGYRIDGKIAYAAEGAIFVAGATVKWLRDALGLIREAAETEDLAASLEDNGGVYLVPAFVGLGAPQWRPDVTAHIAGLTLDRGRAHIARAALEAVAYQTAELIAAMGGTRLERLQIDGGMTANRWLCQFLADMLGLDVARSVSPETTARGAAYLAGIAVGLWRFGESPPWAKDGYESFMPAFDDDRRTALRDAWDRAVRSVLIK